MYKRRDTYCADRSRWSESDEGARRQKGNQPALNVPLTSARASRTSSASASSPIRRNQSCVWDEAPWGLYRCSDDMIHEASPFSCSDIPDNDGTRIDVVLLAEGRHIVIYQVKSEPPKGLQIGTKVELYDAQEGNYMGISRRIANIRMPEKDSVDFIMQPAHKGEPVFILNASLARGWAELPAWAKAIHPLDTV